MYGQLLTFDRQHELLVDNLKLVRIGLSRLAAKRLVRPVAVDVAASGSAAATAPTAQAPHDRDEMDGKHGELDDGANYAQQTHVASHLRSGPCVLDADERDSETILMLLYRMHDLGCTHRATVPPQPPLYLISSLLLYRMEGARARKCTAIVRAR